MASVSVCPFFSPRYAVGWLVSEMSDRLLQQLLTRQEAAAGRARP